MYLIEDVHQVALRTEAAQWLLQGGGGFEGTIEASKFSVDDVIDLLTEFAEHVLRKEGCYD